MTEPPLALGGHDGDGPNPRILTLISDPAALAYGGARLGRGEFLRNQSLTSASGRCTLQNAFKVTTLYDNATGEALWVAPIRHDYGTESSFAVGLDGDLAVWNRDREVLWNSETAGCGVECLEVRDNGELVLLDGAGGTVWTTGTRVGPALWPDAGPGPGRGAVLRRGQSLRRQSLTSDDGSTVLFHHGRGVQLRGSDERMRWSAAFSFLADGAYLALGEDGMLRIQEADDGAMCELAGPGQVLVVVRDRAQLRDAAGTVVWTTARGGLPDAMPLARPPGPAESRLQVWIDSLTAGRGYSAAVVLDVQPAEALRRRGLPDTAVSRSTWEQLRARRDATGLDTAAVVGAVALGRHTLVLADVPWLPGGPLSTATVAVTSTRAPGRESEWTMHRDGEAVAHLREVPPLRRKGVKLPDVARALTEMDSFNASWTAEFQGLELMCRVTGVSPTAAGLGGELLGGLLTVPRPNEPAVPRPNEPDFRAPPKAGALPAITLGDKECLVVVRTDYSNDAAWAGVLEALAQPEFNVDTDVHAVTGHAWAGAGPDEILGALPPAPPDAVFIADATAMNTEGYPLLAVSTTSPAHSEDYEPEQGVTREFRAEARVVAGIHEQFEVGNMSFEEFSEVANCDPGGVFRGFD
jgi:hypothetical protein